MFVFAACARRPAVDTAPVPEAATDSMAAAADSVVIVAAEEDPAWLSDTLAFGTATLENGEPAHGADVYVGIAEGVSGDCGAPWGVKGLTRTLADREGRWSTRVPRAERGRPGCLHLSAEVRDTSGPVDRVTAFAFLGVDLDSMPVHVRLQPVPPPQRDTAAPVDGRGDFVWPLVAEAIPGWAGWINGPGGGCSAIVSLRDTSQQPAARAYVEAELAARRHPSDAPCARFDLQFQQVRWGWADLMRYGSRSWRLVYFHGVDMYDMDEVANRVVYRFRYAQGARAARRALAVMRVPPDVVVIEETEDAERAGAFGPETPVVGRALAPSRGMRPPTWSADSREVLVMSEDSGQLVVDAADAATGDVREVLRASVPHPNGVMGLERAADGTLYADYYPQDYPPETSPAIYRLRPGGRMERVHEMAMPGFRIDSAGRRFLFRWHPPGKPDDESLVVWDPATRRRHVVGGMSGEMASMEMEPGGRAVLYDGWRSGSHPDSVEHGVWIYDLQRRRTQKAWSDPEYDLAYDAASTQPPPEPETREAFAAARWVDGQARLLLTRRHRGADEVELLELDPTTGVRTRLGSIPAGARSRPPAYAAWTPDGRRAVLWVTIGADPPECLEGMCGGLGRRHSRLYLWQAGAEPRIVADLVEHAAEGGWMAISPDGRRIAYEINGSIMVDDLPP